MAATSMNVPHVLDHGKWGKWQFLVVFFSAMAVVLDGFDNQLLGLAVPSLALDWTVARSAFAPVFAVGFVGMLTGAWVAGYVADRFGRRPALIGSVLLFGVATLGVVWVHGIPGLTMLRFISGVGLGGAIPMGGTMTAEFTPLRGRAMAVMLTIVCVPLGGALAGSVAAKILPVAGWRTLFALGGGTALGIGLILLAVLPESPRFMAYRPGRKQDLIGLLRRFGHAVGPETEFEGPPRAAAKRSGPAALFAPAHRRDTLSLWLAFLFCTMSVYMAFNWLPSLLTSEGLSVAEASAGLAAYNFGGVLGPILWASLIAKVGSRVMLLAAAGCGCAMAIALGAVPPAAGSASSGFTWALGVFGFFVNATQTTLYALAAHIYPTSIRGTGVSWAAGAGRVGAILVSYIGAIVILAGHTSYFIFQAGMMAMAFIGIVLVAGHIPPIAKKFTSSASWPR